jgi:predicted enzyme related to lactoylglutathione lyase
MKIKLTSIYVKDPIEAFKFYTEILRFKELMYMPNAKLAIVVSPEEPQGTALLLEPNSNTAVKSYQETIYSTGFPSIVLGVDDVQKEFERLKSLGVTFKEEPTNNEWGIEAVFDDTCGNYIKIHQDPKAN